MKTLRPWPGSALALIACGALARDVQSLQPLLLEALDTGRAQGVIVGPIADNFAQLFKTREPLLFSVRRIAALSPQCARLEVTASQEHVWDRNSVQVAKGPEHRHLTYQVSMCADGTYYEAKPIGANR